MVVREAAGVEYARWKKKMGLPGHSWESNWLPQSFLRIENVSQVQP